MASYHAASSECSQSVLSIQELIKKPLTSIPQRYIRPYDHQSSTIENETLASEIPTINLKNLIDGDATELELGKLSLACKEWGFFQVHKFAFSFYT